eukprot:GSMAST32.ASY1.ANO1.2374.1 assembled CDS
MQISRVFSRVTVASLTQTRLLRERNVTFFSSLSDGPLVRYNKMVSTKRLTHDDAQAAALVPLQRLHEELEGYEASEVVIPEEMDDTSALSGMFSTVTNFFASAVDARNSKQRYDPATHMPLGVYLHGGVGCGKTMLMDMFFEGASPKLKRRVHFHAFMLEVHERMHTLRKNGLEGDPIPTVVKDISQNCSLLCFDEFQVTDVADALVMRRLFSLLIDYHGVIVVATSNRPPDDLYHNGIQRDLFLPFIKRLKKCTHVHDMESPTDFRLLGTDARSMYLLPCDSREKQIESLFQKLTKGTETKSATLTSQGRQVHNNVAKFTFAQLCREPRGAADYITLSKAFHTFFLLDVPVLGPDDINPTRRFITLIDALYEARVKLVVSAAEVPEKLLREEHSNEAFAFDRTISRLIEMQTIQYITAAHRRDVLFKRSKKLFDTYDVDSDLVSVDLDLVDKLFDIIDINMNGSLDFEEFSTFSEKFGLASLTKWLPTTSVKK